VEAYGGVADQADAAVEAFEASVLPLHASMTPPRAVLFVDDDLTSSG
jgi:hypothetical protein